MEEWYFGQPQKNNPMVQYYSAFYGRGVMQLTWAGNYAEYGRFRSIPSHSGPYVEKLTPRQPRITESSMHWTADPASDHSEKIQWAPRYDPDLLASDAYSACDSGGFYWVSKHHGGHININRKCDEGINVATVLRISILVNGGGNGRLERQAYAAYLDKILGNGSQDTAVIKLAVPPQSIIFANLERPQE